MDDNQVPGSQPTEDPNITPGAPADNQPAPMDPVAPDVPAMPEMPEEAPEVPAMPEEEAPAAPAEDDDSAKPPSDVPPATQL